MVEMNIQSILESLNLQEEFETGHTAVYEMNEMDADYFVIPRDLQDSVPMVEHLIVLDSLIDLEELQEKLTSAILNES